MLQSGDKATRCEETPRAGFLAPGAPLASMVPRTGRTPHCTLCGAHPHPARASLLQHEQRGVRHPHKGQDSATSGGGLQLLRGSNRAAQGGMQQHSVCTQPGCIAARLHAAFARSLVALQLSCMQPGCTKWLHAPRLHAAAAPQPGCTQCLHAPLARSALAAQPRLHAPVAARARGAALATGARAAWAGRGRHFRRAAAVAAVAAAGGAGKGGGPPCSAAPASAARSGRPGPSPPGPEEAAPGGAPSWAEPSPEPGAWSPACAAAEPRHVQAASGQTDGGRPPQTHGPPRTAGRPVLLAAVTRTGPLPAAASPCPARVLPRCRHARLPSRRHERAVDQPALLPLLLPPVPQPHRRQAGLPAPGAHLRRGPRARARRQHQHRVPARRRRGAVEAALEGPGGFPVLPEGAGQHRGVCHQEQPREPHRLHVRPLRAGRQVHGALLARQRCGPGADEQLLHRAGHPHQLQHLLLRLLGLRRQHGQALGEEPLLRHRRRVAGAADAVRDQPREHHFVRTKHRHRAHG